MGVALWLCPKRNSPIYDTLNSLIIGLNPLFDNCPLFEPHITITSGLSINSMQDVATVLNSCIAALQTSTNPNSLDSEDSHPLDIDVQFNGLYIKHKNSYFKKIYLSVNKTKNLAGLATIIRELYVEMPNLQNQAKSKYSAQDWCNNQFDPHLSLVYTDLNHFDNAIIKTIKTRVEDLLDTDPLIVNQEDELQDYEMGWKNGTLKIVRCEGPVQEWQVLAQVDIHK